MARRTSFPLDLDNGEKNMLSSGRPPDSLVADLFTIRLDLLQAGSESEHEKLFAACEKDGIFYLDFRQSGADLVKTIEGMHQLSLDTFARLSEREKVDCDVDKFSSVGRHG